MSSLNFGADHGLIHEVIVTGRKRGGNRHFWSALAHQKGFFDAIYGAYVDEVAKRMSPLVCTLVQGSGEPLDSRCVGRLMGVTLVGDVEDPQCVGPSKFKFVRVLGNGERSIGGNAMIERAVRCGASRVGWRTHEAFMDRLETRGDELLRPFSILFPGTVYASYASTFILSVCWKEDGGKWYVGAEPRNLGREFTQEDLFIVPSNV